MLAKQLYPSNVETASRATQPTYKLCDFANPEYADSVVPVQMLMAIMVFTIIMLNQVFLHPGDGLIVSSALLFGSLYLISFMFYLTEYYKKLWEKYFLLPIDKLFFRFYCLLFGVVVIVLMPRWPEHWSLYVVILFTIMYWKKRRTRDYFQSAVKYEFGSYELCTDDVIRSKYILVETFTRNFLILGLIALLPLAITMSFIALCVSNGDLLNTANTFSGSDFTNDELRWAYFLLNLFVTIPTFLFWSAKITTGLAQMRNQIEEGHYAYFECRDIRSRLRRGWNFAKG